MSQRGYIWLVINLLAASCGPSKFSAASQRILTADDSAKAKAVTAIAVTPATPTVSAGDTQQFVATATYADGKKGDISHSVTWASADTALANFVTPATAGLITALKVGVVKVTASSGGVKGDASLTVTAATLKSIAIVPGNISGAVGGTTKLKAIGTYSDGTTADITGQVTFSSGDPTIASADTADSSTVTGLKAGTTSVTATLGGVTSSVTVAYTSVPPSIKFGLLFDDMQCGMCHLDIHGTIISVGDVAPMRNDSSGHVFGKWLVSGAYHATDNNTAGAAALVVDGKVSQNYNNSGKELPVDATGNPIFPVLDFTTLSTMMRGSVAATATGSSVATITKVYNGNTVLIGTKAAPIKIDKDVLVQGDLVIKGAYSGIGTIYVTGNIYIPANLQATSPAHFPYSDVEATADISAAADIAAKADALGLAAKGSIFIADLRNYDGTFGAALGTGHGGATYYQSIFTSGNDNTPAFFATNTGMENIYNWKPEVSYDLLYETIPACSQYGIHPSNAGLRAFNRIDAFLYSPNTIGGVARGTNFAINGRVIAKAIQILSDSARDVCGNSTINYDARLRNGGLPILEHLATFFPGSTLGSN